MKSENFSAIHATAADASKSEVADCRVFPWGHCRQLFPAGVMRPELAEAFEGIQQNPANIAQQNPRTGKLHPVWAKQCPYFP